jgi:predicted PurR-regulated permease PerM
MNGSSNETDKKKTTLFAYLILLGLIFVVTFWMIAPYLLAVMTGIILALICRPAFVRMRASNVGPRVAATLISLLVTLLLLGPVSGFVVAAVDEGLHLSKYVTGDQFPSFESIASQVTRWKPIESLVGDPSAVEKQLRGGIQNAAKTVSTAVLSAVGSLPELGLQLFLVILTLYFALLDGRKCLTWLSDKVPLDRDVRERLMNSFRNTAISSIWATMAAGLSQALIMLAAFLTLGVPAAFLAAGATFIFSWVPLLGSGPVWLAGAVYLYTQVSFGKAMLMIAFGILTSITDNIVRPLVLKGRDDMHPLISLVAIFGGIYLFGILGVFFGPILFAVFLSLINIWPAIAKRFHLMDDSV